MTTPKAPTASSPGISAVEELFAAKGEARSQVIVTVTKLRDRAALQQQKTYWKAALDRLQVQVER